ncbi:MAG: hypothetical protein ACP5GS_08525 [Nitrososphaeria archaeon]
MKDLASAIAGYLSAIFILILLSNYFNSTGRVVLDVIAIVLVVELIAYIITYNRRREID